MEYMYIVMIVIGSILALVAIWLIAGYNRLAHLRVLTQEAWSGMDVQLKRRYDLIPNLVASVQGYSIHEKNIIDDIVRMRAASMGATGVQEKATAEAGLTQSLKTLFAIAEQYPNLKANENFLALQKELSNIEQELQLSRRYYNGASRNYNVQTIQFPSSVVAKLFGYAPVPYFELTTPEERNAPKVNF